MFELLDEAFNSSIEKPTPTELVLFLFFDKGIGLKEFVEYPIPYIVSMLSTNAYIREQERKELEKK